MHQAGSPHCFSTWKAKWLLQVTQLTNRRAESQAKPQWYQEPDLLNNYSFSKNARGEVHQPCFNKCLSSSQHHTSGDIWYMREVLMRSFCKQSLSSKTFLNVFIKYSFNIKNQTVEKAPGGSGWRDSAIFQSSLTFLPLSIFFLIFIYFIYLAALGLRCSTWDLLAVACGI